VADRKFDLVETISNLLKRIEEGRQTLRAQGGIFEEFRSAVERRERAFELWRVSMSAPLPEGEPARGEAERERESLKFEYERLNKESTSLFHKQGEIVAFVGPFANDVALLADRLPLTPEWNAYRGAIQRLSVSTVAAWHPPTSPDLGTLELRLIEMLALAAERPPRHHAASGANREPDRRIGSAQAIEQACGEETCRRAGREN
jgi:hypothetical protein